MLLCWDIQEKEADLFQEAIKSGLVDASVRGRELSRLSYLNFRELFPKRAERLKNELQNIGLKARLEKEEEFHDQEKAAMNAASGQPENEPLSITTSTISTTSTGSGSPQGKLNNPKKQNESHNPHNHTHTHNNHTTHTQSHNNHTHQNEDTNTDNEDVDAILLESSAILPQNAHLLRRQTHNDDAISSIQALIRGNLVRRQSSRYAIHDTHDENNTNPTIVSIEDNHHHHHHHTHTHTRSNTNNSHLPSHIILATVGEDNERRLSSLSDTSSRPNSPEKNLNSLMLPSSSSPLRFY